TAGDVDDPALVRLRARGHQGRSQHQRGSDGQRDALAHGHGILRWQQGHRLQCAGVVDQQDRLGLSEPVAQVARCQPGGERRTVTEIETVFAQAPRMGSGKHRVAATRQPQHLDTAREQFLGQRRPQAAAVPRHDCPGLQDCLPCLCPSFVARPPSPGQALATIAEEFPGILRPQAGQHGEQALGRHMRRLHLQPCLGKGRRQPGVDRARVQNYAQGAR
ncbi:hypothetical protein RZS08_14440, partial [Arthrospira platensis SPKY1]|nr:hypothetical protein [Arthrospira platensis SPKY1]